MLIQKSKLKLMRTLTKRLRQKNKKDKTVNKLKLNSIEINRRKGI